MILRAVILCLILGLSESHSLAENVDVSQFKNIQNEIHTLELSLNLNQINTENAIRLGHIYYLLGRCEDVIRVFEAKSNLQSEPIYCACSRKSCDEKHWLSQKFKFRKSMDALQSVKDPEVMKFISNVKGQPELMYEIIHTIQQRQKLGIRIASEESELLKMFEKELAMVEGIK